MFRPNGTTEYRTKKREKRPRTGSVALSLLFIPLLLAGQGASRAQSGTPLFTEAGDGSLFGVRDQKLTYINKDGTPTTPGKAFIERLSGNGTRAGYALSHGGIIPNTVSVSVGAHTLRPNVDYYLDPLSGSMAFAEPVRRRESISVRYRYVEGQDANRSNLGGVTGFALNLNSGTSLNLGFGVSTNAAGLDFNTYGLALNSKFGSGGLSTMNGLVYFSTPGGSRNNLLGDSKADYDASLKKAQSADAQSDHLITQNLLLKAGAASFRASYQDVGSHFSGFQAMKQSNAKNADIMAQLGALEKESGVKRMGFGAGLNLGKGAKPGNLGLDWDTIQDGTGSITRQSLGFQNGQFNLKYSEQSVDQTFTKFQGLREADAAQWAREKGVKRTDLAMGMALGAPAKDGKTGHLGFNQNRIADASGSLDRQGFDFNTNNLNITWNTRSSDAAFTRLNDLSDADKTALALEIRRQFNPNAAAGEVTAQDKAQIVSEAGLTRDQIVFGGAMDFNGFGIKTETPGQPDKAGKPTKKTRVHMPATFLYNRFSISDTKGGIERQSFNIKGKGFAFDYMDQSISSTFAKLGTMSDFEKTQFGNESGIRRQALGLNLDLGRASTLAFSQLSLGDDKGHFSRQSLAYAAKGIDLKFNQADTDQTFSRIADLAGFTAEQKAAMEAERGYRRTDFSAAITSIKHLSLTSYTYDATNAADKLDKNIYRHNLVWAANKTTQISLLSEGNSYDKEGKTQEARAHSLFTYDTLFNTKLGKGMKFNMYHDTVASIVGGSEAGTVTTDFLHFETDRTKANNLLAETKRIDLGAGKFENTTNLDVNYVASKVLSFHFNRLGIDRGKDPSATTDTMEWKWQVNKVFNFSGLYAETGTNNQTNVTTKSFAATGKITKNMNLTGTYSEINQHKVNVKAVSDISLSTIKPVNIKALGAKDVTLTARYASVNDQKKQQSEIAATKIQGLFRKNQVTMEYGGTLLPNGQRALARTLAVVTDPNPKLPLHVDVLYKSRNINQGELQLVRKYNAALKLDKKTSATYVYTSLPEDAAQAMQPVKSSCLAIRRTMSKTMNLAIDYTTAKQLAQQTETSKLGLTLSGQVEPKSTVEVGYSVDLGAQGATTLTDVHTLKLAFDNQIDGDHFLTLSTLYKMCKHQPNDLEANLDFKTRF